MSALAEALVAAQRRALAAVEKAVVAGTLAETDATVAEAEARAWDQRTARAELELGHIGGAP